MAERVKQQAAYTSREGARFIATFDIFHLNVVILKAKNTIVMGISRTTNMHITITSIHLTYTALTPSSVNNHWRYLKLTEKHNKA